jgi:hypothetical protein
MEEPYYRTRGLSIGNSFLNGRNQHESKFKRVLDRNLNAKDTQIRETGQAEYPAAC